MAEIEPGARLDAELKDFRSRFSNDWFGEPDPKRKVGVVILEILFTGFVSAALIAPILSRALNLMTERAHIILGTATGILVLIGVDTLKARLEEIYSLNGKLDFLTPYFGNRITHAIRTLKG